MKLQIVILVGVVFLVNCESGILNNNQQSKKQNNGRQKRQQFLGPRQQGEFGQQNSFDLQGGLLNQQNGFGQQEGDLRQQEGFVQQGLLNQQGSFGLQDDLTQQDVLNLQNGIQQPKRVRRQQDENVVTTTPASPTTASPEYLNCLSNCPTTNEYNPVCGSDTLNYHNPQKLTCAQNCGKNVQQRRLGTCRPL